MTVRQTILFIHSGHDWIRGSERVLLDLAAQLPASRYRPVVWCNAETFRTACSEAGIEVVSRRFPGHSENPWWRPAREPVRETASLIGELDARVVHVNTLECLPWALHAARRARIPVLAHLHLPTTTDERIWSGLHQATLAVGVSRFSVDWIAADGANPKSATMVYNAIVPHRLERGDATRFRAELGIPPSAFVVVTLGSLIPRKDIGTVIEAVRLASAAVHELHLLVVGDGEERARLETQAAHAGLQARIHFAGNRDDAGAILRDAADLLISAARSETFGLNVVEAGYFSVPSVVTAIPPHLEIVEEGRNGLLFAPGNAAQLAERIAQLASAPALRRELGERARKRVRRSFLADRFIEEFEELYQTLMSRPRWRNGWLGGVRLPACYWRLLLARATRRRGIGAPIL
jgi:glycosyltransferase involved in cell wall biosynthesis